MLRASFFPWTLLVLASAALVGCPPDDDDKHAVGAPCESDSMCGTAQVAGRKKDLVCLTQFEAGYCSYKNCSKRADCPKGTVCARLPDDEEDESYCLLECTHGDACNELRSSDSDSLCTDALDFQAAEDEPSTLKACCPPSEGE